VPTLSRSSRLYRGGRSLVVSVAGRRSMWRTASRNQIKCLWKFRVRLVVRERNSSQIARIAARAASGSGVLWWRRVGRIGAGSLPEM
jgi:hypothetical protein